MRELSDMTVSSILGSRRTSKCPVPIGAIWPSITFFRNATTVIELTDGSGFEENLDRLFERTPHERTSVGTVDAVTSDGNDAASVES